MANKSETKIRLGDKKISWRAPEFVYFEKSKSWYITLVTVGLLLIVALYFLDKNYLGMVMVLLAVSVMIIIAKQKPKNREYSISKKGIEVNNDFMPFSEFKSFYLTYVGDKVNLHLEKTKTTTAPVSILLDDKNEKLIYKYIGQVLPEKINAQTPATDLFSNWFKF